MREIVIFGALGALALWIASIKGFFRHSKGKRNVPFGFGPVLIGFVCWFASQFLISFLVGFALSISGEEGFSGLSFGWTLVAASIGSFIVLLWAALSLRWPIWGCFKPLSKTIGMGLCAWLVAYPIAQFVGALAILIITFFVGPVEEQQGIIDQIEHFSSYPILTGFVGLVVVVVAPLGEEIIFRGLLQSWLRKFMGVWSAVLITSVIFALFHFSLGQGLANGQIIPFLFVLSLFMGYIYERQKSLWAPISVHMISNGVTFLILQLT